MTFAGPLYAFVLLNATMVVITWFLTITHLTSWFETYFYPKKGEIENEWYGMSQLEIFAHELSFQLPSWACCCPDDDGSNDEILEQSMKSLRIAAIVRCFAGGIALLLAPTFSAMMLGHVGLV